MKGIHMKTVTYRISKKYLDLEEKKKSVQLTINWKKQKEILAPQQSQCLPFREPPLRALTGLAGSLEKASQ